MALIIRTGRRIRVGLHAHALFLGGGPLGRARWACTQHKAIDDYGNQPGIVCRVTIDGPVSVGIDGRHGKRRNSGAQVTAAA